jgi:hypothetical protein
MRFLKNLLELCLGLPWWGALAVLGGLVAFFYGSGLWFRWKFKKIVHEAVLEAGSALEGAEVTVHSVKAVATPKELSPYDLSEDDEQFAEGIDGEAWDEDGVCFYSIDVTITPAKDVAWDPTGLAMVPTDFEPDDPTDVCDQLCGLHSAERFVNGRFEPAPEGEVRGPQRLRLLFGVHEGLRAAKFANLVTYFGHIDLPVPLTASSKF